MSPTLNCDSHKSPGKLQSTKDQNENDRYVKDRDQSEALASENFEESDLHLYIRSSLKSNSRAEATRQLLSRLMTTDSAKAEDILAKEFDRGQDGGLSNGVSDIDSAGNAIMENQTRSPREFWRLLQRTNATNTTASRDPPGLLAFGRVIRIHTLTPLVTLQLLVCLGTHFDLERLFSTFISEGPSRGYLPQPGFDSGRRHTWSFTMKYYYLGPHKETVFSGQRSADFHDCKESQRIYRGSSSVALRLAGDGAVCALPWRVLILSCNQQPQRSLPSLVNGIEAYLWAVNHEMTGVRRKLREVAEQIFSTTIPSDEILFNIRLKEAPLFEDSSYTNSRTYFWGLQSLRTLNRAISSLISAWEYYENPGILNLIQMTEEQRRTTSNDAFPDPIKRSMNYLSDIKRQTELLKSMIESNNAKQDEILALRDGLFNASAVLEARNAIKQGENIRILTIISMVFLPAGFVTSIFGMQILPASTGLLTFAIVMPTVCIPTYFIMLSFFGSSVGVDMLKIIGLLKHRTRQQDLEENLVDTSKK